MNLLAIDTSSNACSIALQINDEIDEKHVVEPREHSRILIPMISELLAGNAVTLRDLDGIVLGKGPGSFIGMRIGASVVQGLCFASGLSVIPVSSLAAVAAETFDREDASQTAVTQDAHMNEVYLACYTRDADGLPCLLGDEQICKVGKLPIHAGSYTAAGGGWERYADLLSANKENLCDVSSIRLPRSRYLLRLGAVSADRLPPERLEPTYLRMKVAEKSVSPS